MKNIIKTNKTKIINYLIILFIAICILKPLYKSSFLKTDDGGLHILRIIGVADIIESGQFPPIISPNYIKTCGYAINLFYNPLTTYIPIIIAIFTKSYFLAVKIFITIMVFLAGIFMYNLAEKITKKESISLLASAIYIISPYYLQNIVVRGALAEVCALTFIPLTFLGLYNLIHEDGKKHYLLTIGATCLVLTHNITTIYVALFCIIYLLVNIKTIIKNKSIIKKCIINVIFIILLTTFFTIPLVANSLNTEYVIFSEDLMGTSKEQVYLETLNIIDLFKFDKEERYIFIIGLPILIGLILTPFIKNKIDDKYKKIYYTFIVLGLISIYMSTKLFPWTIMPSFLCIIQFPWRLLGIATFFLSIISAINIYNLICTILKNKENIAKYFAIPIICLFILYIYNIPFEIDTDIKQDETYEENLKQNMQISHFDINREYLPLKARKYIGSYLKTRDNKINILSGQADIKSEDKQQLKYKTYINKIEQDTILEFPYLYYLGYDVKKIDSNGNETKLEVFESEHGFIAIQSDKTEENIQIEVEYKTPTIYILGYIISAITLIIFVIYIKTSKTKENNKTKKEIFRI